MHFNIKILMFVSVFLSFVTCKSVLDEKIDPTTIDELSEDIRKEISGMYQEKSDVLDFLVAVNKGYETFKSFASVIPVEEEMFKQYKDQLFHYVTSNETTYKQLFKEIETAKTIDKKYNSKFDILYLEIDQYCNDQQTIVDQKYAEAQRTIDKISEYIDVNIISMNTSRYFQHQSIDVLMQIKNTTKTPIEALDFNLIVTKNGKVVAKLPVHMQDRIVSNKMKKLSYSIEKYPAIFNALKNEDIYSIALKEEVYKIKHGDQLIDAYEITRGIKDYHYKTAETLNGDCPYLKEGHQLKKDFQQIEKDKKNNLLMETPNLEKINSTKKLLIIKEV